MRLQRPHNARQIAADASALTWPGRPVILKKGPIPAQIIDLLFA